MTNRATNTQIIDKATADLSADFGAIVKKAKEGEGAIAKATMHLFNLLQSGSELPIAGEVIEKGQIVEHRVTLTFPYLKRYVEAKRAEGTLAKLPVLLAMLSDDYRTLRADLVRVQEKPKDRVETPEDRMARSMVGDSIKATMRAAEQAARRVIHGVVYLHSVSATGVAVSRKGHHSMLSYQRVKIDAKTQKPMRKDGKPVMASATMSARNMEKEAKVALGIAKPAGAKRDQSEGTQPNGAADTVTPPSNLLVSLTTAAEHFKRYGVGSIRVDEMKAGKLAQPQEIADAAVALVSVILDTFDEDRWQAEQEKRNAAKTGTDNG